MNFDDIIQEVIADRSAQAIHKQVLVGQEFQPRTFYRVPMRRDDLQQAGTWLEDQFGKARPHQTWWIVAGSVFMESQIYTWWCLGHGVPR